MSRHSDHKCDEKCLGWWARRRKRRDCWHHVMVNPVAGTAHSLIKNKLIETGKAKMYCCDEQVGGCGKVWIT